MKSLKELNKWLFFVFMVKLVEFLKGGEVK